MEARFDLRTSLLVGIVGCLLLVLTRLLNVKPDPKEPPYIPHFIPYVGHILSILRSGTKYYSQISARYSLPIYSLGMLGGRMYVVNSPELVIAVQRNSKTLTSAPFAVKYASQVFSLSKNTKAVWMDNIDMERGPWGLHHEGMSDRHHNLAHGREELDQVNEVTLERMSVSLQNLEQGNAGQGIFLMEWLRHEMTLAATDAMYGPMNPFKEQEVENGFWDFYDDFTMLLVNFMPRLTARKGNRGRERFFKAFVEWLRNGGPKHHSSELLKARYRTNLKYNIPIDDMARFEIGDAIAALVNIVPTCFWCLYQVYSDPAILNELRRELAGAVSTTIDYNGARNNSLDVSRLRVDCPLLTSTFQEVLRVRSVNSSVRIVTRDTLLNDRYLLKKDAIVQMPSRVIHRDESVWGPTANEFNAHRFYKSGQKLHSGILRGFGGGTTLCPGRHFAMTTVLSISAMFILRYDIQPASGKWLLPTQNINNHVAAVLPPDQDVLVNITPQKGQRGESWKFISIDSKSRSALSVVE